jgi:toxin YoeB
MKVVWSSVAWADYLDWQQRAPRIATKIEALIADVLRNPFRGIGRPEPLRANLTGWWSRRITEEHRLVYRVTGKRGPDQRLEILQCRFHYR